MSLSDLALKDTETWGTLLKKDPELVKKVDGYQYNCLHYQSWMGNIENAKLSIKNGCNVNARTKLGETPLHFAAEGGHIDIIKILLQLNVNINVADNQGINVLMKAAYENHAEVIIVFLKTGVNISMFLHIHQFLSTKIFFLKDSTSISLQN